METIKLSFIGRSNAGRSCLLNRFIYKNFDDTLCAKIGNPFYQSSMKMNDGKEIKKFSQKAIFAEITLKIKNKK